MTGPMEAFRARARSVSDADRTAVVPITRAVTLDGDTAVSAFAKLHRGGFGFLLESVEGGERWARFTFLGTTPREVYRYRGRAVERWTPEAGWGAATPVAGPLDHLAGILRSFLPIEAPELPGFLGGAVGYLGYDLVRSLEDLPDPPPDDRDLPDAMLMVTDTLVVIDNLRQRATIVHGVRVPADVEDGELERRYREGEARLAEWETRLAGPGDLPPLPLDRGDSPGSTAAGEAEYDRDRFLRDVATIKEYIRAGDTFQTVLSRRVAVSTAPDPFLTYRALRALNPAPYLYYLAFDDLHIVGSSPEALVRVADGEMTVRPIAGTRPRGDGPAADRALADELRADPKERAEHMMLLDLGRNDVGRVARPDSVRVTECLAIERYSHVMHLVSEVRGHLGDGLDAVDAFAATFPAGTVTGAPKVRAMEIIDELEPVRRGPYAGAVGYFGWGAATADTAIAIRTAVFQGRRAWIQAGAGIVADSDPAAEWRETEAKAAAVRRALQLAAGAEDPAGAGVDRAPSR